MAAAYLAVGVYYKDRFFPGSYINGEDCSGMTVDEVEKGSRIQSPIIRSPLPNVVERKR